MRIRGLQRLRAYGSAPLGYVRSHRQIRVAIPGGAVRLGARIALVCHHDPLGRLRDDLLHYLRALRDAEFSVVLVSNSGALHPECMAAARTLCAAVLVRRNLGLDFCAWRDAMEHLALPRADTRQVLLANDSVYGPLRPLVPLFARIGDAPGLWGMTDSRERGFHLQSYFLLAQTDVLHSVAWRDFWRSVRPLPSKWLVVGRYEIGLTQRLLRAGFDCKALFSGMEPGSGTGANPTLRRWHDLLDAGLPFIKRELLRDNPYAAADLAAWRTRVPGLAGTGLLQAIERDLARTLHARSAGPTA